MDPRISEITRTETWSEAQAISNERRRELHDLPNVNGTAIGAREVDGEIIAEPALIVYVVTKVSADSLSEEERIPEEINGVPTDVQEVGNWVADSYVAGSGGRLRKQATKTYMGGYSVSHSSTNAGSAGPKMLDAAGNEVVLTNRHMASDSLADTSGDLFQQPGTADAYREGVTARTLGVIKEVGPWNPNGTNYTDSALIRVDDARSNVHATSRFLGAGHLVGWEEPVVGQQQVNFGRTTGLTSATITAVNATANVNYGHSTLYFENVVISGRSTAPGDSGSISGRVDHETGDVYGLSLHFAGSDTTGRSIAVPPSALTNAHGNFTPITSDVDENKAYEPPHFEEWPFVEVTPVDNKTNARGQFVCLAVNTGGDPATETVTLDVDGARYASREVDLLPTEHEVIRFDVSGVAGGSLRDFTVSSADQSETVSTSITTQSEFEIRASVTDRAGNPVSGVSVSVSNGTTVVDTVETDADGIARTYRGDGTYTLTYTHPQYDDASSTVTIAGANQTTGVTLQPTGFATGTDHYVRLRVQGARKREVPGATVTVRGSNGAALHTLTADGNGYVLAWLDPANGPFGLAISEPNHESKALSYDPAAEGDSYEVETRLPPEGYHYLRVGVRNANGYPVENATVGAHVSSEIPDYWDTTDRSGTAELVVPTGNYVLSAEAPGFDQKWEHYRPGEMDGDTVVSPVELVGQTGWYDLVRTVKDRKTGKAIRGAELSITGARSETTRTTISGRGNFWLQSGEYQLSIDGGISYATYTESVGLSANNVAEATLTPVGASEYALTVTINDRFGNPLEGAAVSVEGNGPTDSQSGSTDATGQITFNGLIEGEYTITASAENYNTTSKTISLLAATGTTLILYRSDGTVSTTMSDAYGEVDVSLRGGSYIAYAAREGYSDGNVAFTVGDTTPTPRITLQSDEPTAPTEPPTLRRISWSRQADFLTTDTSDRNGMIARGDPGHRSDRHSVRLGHVIQSDVVGAYWPLDETGGDIVEDMHSDYNATVNGATLGEESVLGGTAAQFDGVNDSIDAPVAAGDPIAFGGAFTVRAIVKKVSEQNNQTILRNGFSEPGIVFLELRSDSRISFGYYDGGSVARFSDQFHAGNAVPGEWHHIVATYQPDANELAVYLNGARETLSVSSTRPAPPTGSGNSIGIGRRISGSDRPFDGYIGQVGLHAGGISEALAKREYAVLSGASLRLPPRTT